MKERESWNRNQFSFKEKFEQGGSDQNVRSTEEQGNEVRTAKYLYIF